MCQKKVKFCCPVKYVNIHIFSQLTWLSQTNCRWWRKTTYTFEFSFKISIMIRYFSSCAKKKVKFCWSVLLYWCSFVISSYVVAVGTTRPNDTFHSLAFRYIYSSQCKKSFGTQTVDLNTSILRATWRLLLRSFLLQKSI